MIQKLKKTVKKRMGLKAKIKRQEFYHALKNGKPAPTPDLLPDLQSAKEILDKIRKRKGSITPKTNPYDAGADRGLKAMFRKMAGLE